MIEKMNIPQPSENLQKLIEKIIKKKCEACTHQFNLLDELHANENAHTRILVRLLQIPSLLHSFLMYLKESFAEQAQFDIPDQLYPSDVSEFSDYIDAKIETKNFCIIIENKINNAVDQDRQIERYVSAVKSQNKNICVLYLTLDGTKDPTSNSIGESDVPVIKINYKKHILNWLENKITFSVSDTLQQPF
jgi:transcriptional regulator of heat shock response